MIYLHTVFRETSLQASLGEQSLSGPTKYPFNHIWNSGTGKAATYGYPPDQVLVIYYFT